MLKKLGWLMTEAVSLGLVWSAMGVLPGSESPASAADAPKVTYIDHVLPILRAKCLSCHNNQKAKGDLHMTSYSNLLKGGM